MAFASSRSFFFSATSSVADASSRSLSISACFLEFSMLASLVALVRFCVAFSRSLWDWMACFMPGMMDRIFSATFESPSTVFTNRPARKSKAFATASRTGLNTLKACCNLFVSSSFFLIASAALTRMATNAVIISTIGFAARVFKAVPKVFAPPVASLSGVCRPPMDTPIPLNASLALSAYLPMLSLKFPTSFLVSLILEDRVSSEAAIFLPISLLRCSSLNCL